MCSSKCARLASVVFSFLMAGLVAGFAGTVEAAPQASWTLQQSLVKSGEVHSPTFISPTRGWAIVGSRLLQTNDGGARWSISLPAEWSADLPTAIAFSDPTHGWAVGRGFVMASTDSGAHWTQQALATAENAEWVDVYAIDAAHAFAVSTSGAVLGTDDGGVAWTMRFSAVGAVLRSVRFADASHGWAVGAGADGGGLVLATADGGTTWARQPNPSPAELSAVCFVDALRGWAAGAGGVLRTADGGATWTSVDSPITASSSGPTVRASLAFVSATHGFLGASEGATGLWETLDGGLTWKTSSPTAEPVHVHGLVALGSAHVLATGLSLPLGEELTTGSVWNWTQAPATMTPAPQVGTTAVAKARVLAHAKAAARKAAQLRRARAAAARRHH